MKEELIISVRKHICKDFLQPEKKEECEYETDKDCMCCASDFIKGWNAKENQ